MRDETVGVSVVVPAFNVAPLLADAVRSVISGGFEDIEVIIVDDASTDATADVARGLAAEDARVRLIQKPFNVGPGAARNTGIAESRFEWVAFLDADDWWLPGRLQHLLQLAEEVDSDIVSDDTYVVDQVDGQPFTTMYRLHDWQQSEPHFLQPHEHCAHSWILKPVIRTRWLREQDLLFPESLRLGEDFVFILDSLLLGARWIMSPEVLSCYRLGRAGSLSGQTEELAQFLEAVESRRGDERICAQPMLYLAYERRVKQLRAARWRIELQRRLRKGMVVGAGALLVQAPEHIPETLDALWRRWQFEVKRRRT